MSRGLRTSRSQTWPRACAGPKRLNLNENNESWPRAAPPGPSFGQLPWSAAQSGLGPTASCPVRFRVGLETLKKRLGKACFMRLEPRSELRRELKANRCASTHMALPGWLSRSTKPQGHRRDCLLPAAFPLRQASLDPPGASSWLKSPPYRAPKMSTAGGARTPPTVPRNDPGEAS